MLKLAYQPLSRSNLKLVDALLRMETEIPTEHTLPLVRFIRSGKRGIRREARGPLTESPGEP